MADKPLDCVGITPVNGLPVMGKSDFITFHDKEHKIEKTRLEKGETITKYYIVTSIEPKHNV